MLSLFLLLLLPAWVSGLVPTPAIKMVVVGKVILDDYRQPGDDESENNELIVGGGGPQAAWGAAAALAALDSNEATEGDDKSYPPAQPVAFLGPVGQWSKDEDTALTDLIGRCVSTIELVQDTFLQTPRIQLWHNEEEELLWKPLENSWGTQGADSLWRNRPSAQDIRRCLGVTENDTTIECLHMIAEVGRNAAGGGEDSLFLQDQELIRRVAFLSVEPVAFPEGETGLVSSEDSEACCRYLKDEWPRLQLLSPDRHLFEALESDSCLGLVDTIAARYGSLGSVVTQNISGRQGAAKQIIPIAMLRTPTGKPLNPTGAGNAYSAALAAAMSQGVEPMRAACLASAIGATFCEYDHLPPWTWEVLHRVRDGWQEVEQKMTQL